MIVKLNKTIFAETLAKARIGDPTAQAQVRQCLQAFLYEPKIQQRKFKSQMQAITVSTDIAELTKKAFNITLAEDNFDLGWERAFQVISLGEYQLSWELFDVANSLTFVQVGEGQRITVNGITGTKTTAYAEYYGGALGFTDRMIRTRQIGAMVENARIFRNKFWISKADVHYALIAAAAALNVTAYNVVPTGELRRDIATIRDCIFALTDRCKDKGYGDMASTRIVVYANPFDEARIEAAFRVTTASLGASNVEGAEITKRHPIDRIYTFNQFILAGHPIFGIPGNKNQRADALPPTTYLGEKDPLTLNEYAAVWAIYGAIIADTDQWQQCDLQ